MELASFQRNSIQWASLPCTPLSVYIIETDVEKSNFALPKHTKLSLIVINERYFKAHLKWPSSNHTNASAELHLNCPSSSFQTSGQKQRIYQRYDGTRRLCNSANH